MTTHDDPPGSPQILLVGGELADDELAAMGLNPAHVVVAKEVPRALAAIDERDIGAVLFVDVELARQCLRARIQRAASSVPPTHEDATIAAGFLSLLRNPGQQTRAEKTLWKLAEELEATKNRYEVLATLDSLTGCLNRRGLNQVLIGEAARAVRSGMPLHAILVDCDDFKAINSEHGHALGDVALATVARRLRESVRPSDHVSRVGGDEFLIILPEVRGTEATTVAERVRQTVANAPITTAPDTIYMTVSMGVSRLASEQTDIEGILMSCRSAIEASKKSGKNLVSVRGAAPLDRPPLSEREITSARSVSLSIDSILDARSPCSTVAQPILRVGDEKVVAYELLTRGPLGPLHRPEALFAAARDVRQLTPVDLYCLTMCAHAAKSLPNGARLHVNLLPSTVAEIPAEQLLEHLTPPERFCVEISEQQLVGDPGYLVSRLSTLRKAGVTLAIDDVGFGRNSLETLLVLAPDLVKIDRSYIHGATRSVGVMPPLRRLTKALAALQSQIVAEGVEDRDEFEMLVDLGIGLAKGFLWGPPKPISAYS